jgi:general secretion pathway protein L
MSLLALTLPPRDRLGARAAGDAAPAARAPAEFGWVLSPDGLAVAATGQASPAALPKADRAVLVLDDADVSWHRIDIPKAPPARLRAALAGAMEELLLDDEEALHFALGPSAAPGKGGWVAVVHRGWLTSALAALEGAGIEVEEVVAASRPRESATGHFAADPRAPEAPPRLVLERRDGVLSVRIDGALARSLLPAADGAVRWTATPAASAAAERWLGQPIAVLSDAERVLAACRNPVNLRQFDLVARHRGLRALREGWKRLRAPHWRFARWGLVALLAVQVVGLNAWAWKQEQTLAAKRQAMNELLRSTHPGVRSVLDAPLQMQRETERLRTAAGRPGDGDFEVLLGAAAAAWPDGVGPAPTLRFEPGKLTLAAPGWGEPQLRQFADRLRGAGFVAETADGRVSVARARAGS